MPSIIATFARTALVAGAIGLALPAAVALAASGTKSPEGQALACGKLKQGTKEFEDCVKKQAAQGATNKATSAVPATPATKAAPAVPATPATPAKKAQ